MAQFRLFVDSSNGVDVDPDWEYSEEDEKIESRHRVRSGKSYVYKWGEYKKRIVPVSFVNSEFKSIVNSYWNTNTDLLFMEVGVASSVTSVRIVNDALPIGAFIMPYTNLFSGVIELETY